MIRSVALAIALVPAAASAEITEVNYLCEDSATLSVLYLTERDPQIVVIEGDGILTALSEARAASGARYEGTTGESGYVWWSRGDEATLYWADGETRIEEPLLTGCAAVTEDAEDLDY